MSARKHFVTFFLAVMLAISLSKNDVWAFEQPSDCLGIQCGPTAHGRYGAYECQKDCQGRGFHNGACFIISLHNTQCCCNK
ncbi:hypothetical protein N665_0232s0003 [Sinapis alba]|nr:hypothetical protein N665_0232s0003 [Sinapis alba]